MLRFEVLGPLVVATSGGAPAQVADRRVRALLADLLVHQGQVVSADRLIDHLWGEQLPANPSATLQTRVSQLRKALEEAEPGGRELVVTRPPGYLLQLAPEQVDAHCFRQLVDQAGQDPSARSRAARYHEALALWRGQAYAEFAGEPFTVATAARLEEERLAAVESLAETRLELGEHALVAAELSELISRYPLRERMRAAQMRALYGSGRQTEALDSFQALRTRLAEELGLDPGQDLEALHQAILNQDASLSERVADADPVWQAADRPAGNLPAALTDLVGRQDLITDVRNRLRAGRLVTLTGPGGVGKTSLALEIGREEAGRHPGGVWLVDLAALPAHASPERVTAAVEGVVTVEGGGLLLVLDNCEHVVDAAAMVVERLSGAAPELCVLATSREPLGVRGERTCPVPPLELPEPGASPEAAGAAAAIRLFVARAADAAPGFELTPGNVGDVIEVCRRLDGLPLALELAANRVRALGVRDLAARLDNRFRLLVSRQRGAFDRQHTLRAVIEWSWELLAGAERTVLSRLAMHAAPCSLQAAEAVCAGGEIAEFDVADLLARLVDRSLVVRVDSGSGSRYRLLETVRAYCLERLEESGERAATERRYAAYYDQLALRSEPRLYGYGEMFARMGDIYLRHGEHDAGPAPTAGPSALTATSKDGTPIAYEVRGQGPLLILAGNTLTERGALRPLAARLADRFTTLVYDRRGRGASGDTPPYTVEREVEDLATLIEEARESVPGSGRGPAYGFGITTGAVLVAEAAARGVGFAAVAIIEPPFIIPGTRTPLPEGFQEHVESLVEAGRRGDAVEYFLSEAVQMAPEVLAPLRSTARWRELEALAHTITYDTAIMNGHVLPAHWADRITAPVLVLDGGLSAQWRRLTAQAVADLLPNARHHTMDGQPHDPDPDILAPILAEFFLDTRQPIPTSE